MSQPQPVIAPETENETATKTPQEMAYEAKLLKSGKDREDIARFIAELPVPDPATLNIPAEFARVYWTDEERDAVFSGVSTIWPKLMATRPDYGTYHRSRILFYAMGSVQEKLLPENRQRALVGWGAVPPVDRERYRKLAGLDASAPLPEPVPASQQVLAEIADAQKSKVVNWSPEEKRSLIIHTAHLIRKQGWKHVPPTDDRTGCIMFNDMVRAAQSNALPAHRRKAMDFPRGVLIDNDMMPQLEIMARTTFLPTLPAKAPELSELKAPAAAPGTTAPAQAPAPAAAASVSPVIHLSEARQTASAPRALADYSDAELFQAATIRLLEHLNKRREISDSELQLAKLREELETDFRLLSDVNRDAEEKLNRAETRIAELERRLNAITAEATKAKAPRVAVLGCRKDQFDLIAERVAERGMNLDLRHYEQQGAKVLDVFADYAILMPGIGHVQEDKVKQVIPRGQYVFISEFSVSKTVAQLVVWFQPSTIM